MTTELEQSMKERRDYDVAHHSAQQICYHLKEFIPDHCFRDAIESLTIAMVKSGVGLTNAQQRKEYEVLRSIMSDSGKIDWIK